MMNKSALAKPILALAIHFAANGSAAHAERLDGSWSVKVNGQVVRVDNDGSFHVPNIAAPDAFGPDGPGTRPDFVADDFIRVVGTSTKDGKTIYAYSEQPFQLEQGSTFSVGNIIVTELPPPLLVSIRFHEPKETIAIGDTLQLDVRGLLEDGNEVDVSSSDSWTSYRSSNARLATISRNGLITAQNAGVVHITAINNGHTFVHRIRIIRNQYKTTLEGFVRLDGDQPASNASVTTPFSAPITTDSEGFFSIVIEIPTLVSIPLDIRLTTPTGSNYSGLFEEKNLVDNGTTDVGILQLQQEKVSASVFFADQRLLRNEINARSVMTADFNNDKVTDIAAVDKNGHISILLGDGNGSFEAQDRHLSANAASFGASADLNGDGNIDIVTINETTSRMSIFLGNGDGTLQTGISSSAGSRPRGIAFGKFNDDAFLDIAVANLSGARVTLFLSTGPAVFNGPKSIDLKAVNPIAIAADDLNDDKKVDLVVVGSAPNAVAVLLGNGDGTFREDVEYPISGSNPLGVALADLDGDRILDVAVANDGGGVISTWQGVGDGTLDQPQNHPIGDRPFAVVPIDLNKDGIIDLVSPLFRNHAIGVLMGIGDATFEEPQIYPAGTAPWALAVADLNGDGFPDAVTGNSALGSRDISILLGKGDGSFPRKGSFTTRINATSVAAADFNQDGRVDLLSAFESSKRLEVRLGSANADFGSPTRIIVQGDPKSVAVDKVNNDDFLDLVAATNDPSQIELFTADGIGGYTPIPPLEIDRVPESLATGDFNQDGQLDYVVVASDDVSVYLRNPTKLNPTARLAVGTNPISVSPGFLDGDIYLDLIVIDSSSHQATVFLGLGDGTFGDPKHFPVGMEPQACQLRDVTDDHKLDLITVNRGTNDITILPGQGDGTFQTPGITLPVGTAPTALSIGDLNRDGNQDIAVGNETTRDVSIYLGLGKGTFSSELRFAGARNLVHLFVGDINGDEWPDLIINALKETLVLVQNRIVNACCP